MKVALISTVFNEEDSIARWIDGLQRQTFHPDEFVIVDGGSKDQTVRELEKGFAQGNFPKPKIIVKRCNIAQGRNLAIQNTTAEVIASIDAGSAPDERWLEELIKPLADPTVGAVGGRCPMVAKSELAQKVERFAASKLTENPPGSDCYPSSRNIAFRRGAWEAVGGYPEWLTLTTEDHLFNINMHFAGVRFYYQPSAVVTWDLRPDLPSYLKMMRSYGFGSGEARLASRQYLRWLVSTLFPPVMLFAKCSFQDIPFRYRSNAAASFGWLKGLIFGRKPPEGWQRINGEFISPQAIAAAKKGRYDAVSDRSR